MLLRINLGPSRLEIAEKVGRKRAARVGPAPNARQADVAPRQRPLRLIRSWAARRPRLVWGWAAPGQAELGRSRLIWALFNTKSPLRRGERGLPAGHLR